MKTDELKFVDDEELVFADSSDSELRFVDEGDDDNKDLSKTKIPVKGDTKKSISIIDDIAGKALDFTRRAEAPFKLSDLGTYSAVAEGTATKETQVSSAAGAQIDEKKIKEFQQSIATLDENQREEVKKKVGESSLNENQKSELLNVFNTVEKFDPDLKSGERGFLGAATEEIRNQPGKTAVAALLEIPGAIEVAHPLGFVAKGIYSAFVPPQDNEVDRLDWYDRFASRLQNIVGYRLDNITSKEIANAMSGVQEGTAENLGKTLTSGVAMAAEILASSFLTGGSGTTLKATQLVKEAGIIRKGLTLFENLGKGAIDSGIKFEVANQLFRGGKDNDISFVQGIGEGAGGAVAMEMLGVGFIERMAAKGVPVNLALKAWRTIGGTLGETAGEITGDLASGNIDIEALKKDGVLANYLFAGLMFASATSAGQKSFNTITDRAVQKMTSEGEIPAGLSEEIKEAAITTFGESSEIIKEQSENLKGGEKIGQEKGIQKEGLEETEAPETGLLTENKEASITEPLTKGEEDVKRLGESKELEPILGEIRERTQRLRDSGGLLEGEEANDLTKKVGEVIDHLTIKNPRVFNTRDAYDYGDTIKDNPAMIRKAIDLYEKYNEQALAAKELFDATYKDKTSTSEEKNTISNVYTEAFQRAAVIKESLERVVGFADKGLDSGKTGKFSEDVRGDVEKYIKSRNLDKNADDIVKDIEKTIFPKIESKKEKLNSSLNAIIVPIPQIFGTLSKIQESALQGSIKKKIKAPIQRMIQRAYNSDKAVVRSIGKTLNSFYRDLPRTEDEFLGQRKMVGEINYSKEAARELFKDIWSLVGFNNESMQRIHQRLDPTNELYKEGSEQSALSEKEQAAFDLLRKVNNFTHELNYKMGMIDEATYLKNKGKYIARAYEEFELPESVKDLVDSDQMLRAQKEIDKRIYKFREDETGREDQIDDAAYLTAKRLMQTLQNKAILDYTDLIHSKGLFTTNEAEAKKRGYAKLEDYRGFGKLTGKYVPTNIAEDMKGFFFTNSILDKGYDFLKAYDRIPLRQFLKQAKTVYNPAVALGNKMSNTVFAFMGGVDPVTYFSNHKEALNQLNDKGETYLKLIKAGLLKSDVLTSDFTPGVTLEKKKSLAKKIIEFPELDYQKSDDLAKLRMFLSLKDYGFSDEKAIEITRRALQDFQSIGKAWDVASKTFVIGNAFVKFTPDMLRLVKNSLTSRPLNTLAFIGLLKYLSEAGDEDKETKVVRQERSGIPKIRIPFSSFSIPLVWKTDYGEINVARYISPYYIYDKGEDNNFDEFSKLLPFQTQIIRTGKASQEQRLPAFSDPMLGVFAQLMTDADFRGESIADPESGHFKESGATNTEKNINRLWYTLRSVVPFFSSGQDMFLSFKYGTDYYGRTKDVRQSIISNFVKIQTFGDAEAEKRVETQLKVYDNKLENILGTIHSIEKQSEKEDERIAKLLVEKKITRDDAVNLRKRRADKSEERISGQLKDMAELQSQYVNYVKNIPKLVQKIRNK